MRCQRVQFTVQADENPDQVFWRHVRASLGEGCCPRCGCRLEPVETGLGLGGMCRHCDHAWAMQGEDTCQWRLTDQRTGKALPLIR